MSRGLHRASGTMQRSDDWPGLASHFACAYRVAYPSPCCGPGQSARGHAVFFRTVPPAPTVWCEGRMETPSSPYCRLDLAPSLADRFIPGVAPIDSGPVLLRKPFGFPLAVGTLPSPTIGAGASEALPPLWDMAPSVRAPGGLQPPGALRCSAHSMAGADFSRGWVASPFQAHGEIPPGKTADRPRTTAGFTPASTWSQALRGHLPARPRRGRLVSGSCSSARVRSPLPSAPPSRVVPCGSLGFLRPGPRRTSTSTARTMPGAQTARPTQPHDAWAFSSEDPMKSVAPRVGLEPTTIKNGGGGFSGGSP